MQVRKKQIHPRSAEYMQVRKKQILISISDLHTCGLDLDKLSELPSNLEKLINVKLEITKRTRGENENVYINRRIVLEDGGDEYDSAARNALAPF